MNATRGLALVATVLLGTTACDNPCPQVEEIPEGQYRIINPPEALATEDMSVTIDDGTVTFRYIDSHGVHDVEYLIVLPDPPPGG